MADSHHGYLNPNTRRSLPTHPDYFGMIVVDGKGYEVGAWKAGGGSLSLSVRPLKPKTLEVIPV